MGKLRITPRASEEEQKDEASAEGMRIVWMPESVYREIEKLRVRKGDPHVMTTLSKALALYARS